jgi:hypothetical protein
MRSLVIDVLSKGLRSRSRPLLRRALADTVMVNGVATEREGAIDAINAELAALRQSNHHFVLSQSPAETTASQLWVVVFSVPDSVVAQQENPGETAAAAHGRMDPPMADVRPTEKLILGGPDTLVRPHSAVARGRVALPADSLASQTCVFLLEDKYHQGAFRVTSVSLASSLKGR